MLLCLALLSVAMPPAAWGDGGAVRLSRELGPLRVTVFTAPTPLRAGPVDVSVYLERRGDGAPVLDGAVEIAARRLDAGTPPLRAAATRAAATNKLLYVAALELAPPGRWELAAAVRADGVDDRVAVAVTVGAPLPPALAYWPYFALPLAVVALFLLHAWLRASGRGR